MQRLQSYRKPTLILIGSLLISLPFSTLLAAPYNSSNNTSHNKHHSTQQRHTDYAKVTDVDPIYKTVSQRIPERSCWTETVYEPKSGSSSYTPTILGTLIGGAIGNEVGHSNKNKKVGAVAGALLGASIASGYNKSSNETVARDTEVCETQHRTEYEERLVGYNVKYRYQGRTYHTRMDRRPGERIKVAVQVKPVY